MQINELIRFMFWRTCSSTSLHTIQNEVVGTPYWVSAFSVFSFETALSLLYMYRVELFPMVWR